MKGLISLQDLLDITKTVDSSLEYMYDMGYVYIPVNCIKCGSPLAWTSTLKSTKRCTKHRSCGTYVHLYKGTLLERKKLPLNDFLNLAYFWLLGLNIDQLSTLFKGKLSTRSISGYVHDFMLMTSVETGSPKKIGGKGTIVQIDESKFFKPKYGKGRPVTSKAPWVFGGVEYKTKKKRYFMHIVPQRDRTTLEHFIKKYIKRHTTIWHDDWASYRHIDKIPYYKYGDGVVNHSKKSYVDHNTGVHTQAIESKWDVVKRKMPDSVKKSKNLQPYLNHFIWTDENKPDLWIGFLEAFTKYTPPTSDPEPDPEKKYHKHSSTF